MIKAFLFDYDGVITKGVDNEWVAGRLARNLNVTIETTSAWMKDIWTEFLKGTISEKEVWKRIEEKYGKPIDRQQRNIWFMWDEVKPLPEMLKLVRSLKQDGYIVGVLSNVFSVTKDLVNAQSGYDAFDFVVASCDLGHKKPEPEIFQAALEKLGSIKPEETVFLDDREANVEAARKIDMTGIHVSDHEDAIRDVKELIN